MFSKIPWRTGIDTGRLSCELHGGGVKSTWSEIRELEPALIFFLRRLGELLQALRDVHRRTQVTDGYGVRIFCARRAMRKGIVTVL